MYRSSFQTSHHRVSNWVTDVQNQQFPIYQPTMPPTSTGTESMYQRSGASGTSIQSQHNLSSAVSLNQSYQMSKTSQRSGARFPKEQSKLNQSVPVTQQSGQNGGAIIIYTFPSTKEEMMLPYMIMVDQYHLSLKDVKDRCPRKGQQYRYFFKTAFEGYEVFEEIHDDAAAVPMFGGLKIVVECRGSDC